MSDAKTAQDRADMPAGTGNILDRRSLTDSHRQLAALLVPGLRVLDVGCGTGAITADVADVVGPEGMVVGTDISQALLAQAGARRASRPHLHFARSDVFALPFGQAFDIVTAARVLQWLANPRAALSAMCRAARPGGIVLVLDYDHEQIEWTPAPPPSMQRFYAAFLAWRADAGFDNAIAGRLPAMFENVGAADVALTLQLECTMRGHGDFMQRASIWADVAATRGHQMVRDGFVSETEREAAEQEYRSWIAVDAESMTLHLVAVQGVIQSTS
jgi:ubiquinone/menaquinone biosynthesis C-methylase UbiE